MKGKVTKINLWKSGKGCFIQIDGTKPDFLFYGKTDVKVGEAVNYEIGKDAPDGKPTLKSIRADGIEAFEARDEDRAKPTQIYRAHDAPKADAREEYWKLKEKRDAEREPIITRLSCISSACAVYEGAQGQDEKILELAAKFEDYAKNGKKEGI